MAPAAADDDVNAPGGTPLPCRVLVDRWFADEGSARRSPATLRARRADLAVIATHIAAALRRSDADDPLTAVDVTDLTRQNLQAAFATHAATHASASCLRARSTWSRFCDWLVLNDHLAGNPLVSIAKPKRPDHERKALDDPELDRVMAAAWTYVPPSERTRPFPELDRALAAVLFGGGLRSSEIVALTVGSIRRRDESLVVLSVLGKGTVRRSVPLAPEMATVIDAYLAARGERFGTPRPTDKLFVTAAGAPFTYDRLAYRVKGWCKAAGIEGTPHTARHTFATALLAGGVSIDVVRDLLGHRSLDTTQLYVKTVDARLQEGALANPMRRRFDDPNTPTPLPNRSVE